MTSKSFPRPPTRQKIEKGVKTIWQFARQLFAVSGVNGISHICLAKTNGRRAFWILLFAIAVTGWFYQTTTLLEYYYKYPTVVKIDVEKLPVMKFPGFTICNVNRIRRSIFCEDFPDRCQNDTIEMTEEEIFDLTFDYMKEGKKSLLGHQIEDMIISCRFTGSPQLETKECLEYFAYVYDPHLGNCFAFVSDGKSTLTVTEPDAWQDIKELELVLNVEEDEYMNLHSASPGMIITIHEDMEFPQIFTHGIHVHSDHTYNLAVEKISVHLLKKPYKSNCSNYEDLPFHTLSKLELTPRICTVECLLYQQKKECGHGYVTDNVVLFLDHMPYNHKEVTEEDKRCANRLSDIMQNYCSTLCGVPCHDIHYALSIDSSAADHELDRDVEGPDLFTYRNRTRSDKKLYAANIKIHYQTMEHRTYRHSPEFNTEVLFSYLGGITGGWLGISLLEFSAFVEGMFSIFFFSFRYCKPKSRNRKKKGRKTPKRLEPFYQGQCHCQCRPDFGTLVLGLPVTTSDRTVQIVPFEYY